MKLKMVATVLVSLSLQACVSGFPRIPGITPSQKQWDYQGKIGPEYWGDLDPNFATCKLGKLQSPIDIRSPELAPTRPISFNYNTNPAEAINNGYTIQVNFGAGSSIRLGSTDYKLTQLQFHTPGEEKVNGSSFPMSAHFVHKSNDGKLVVIAVLYTLGNENQALKPVFDSLPAKEGDKKAVSAGINPADLLPVRRGYYTFFGSLTTPPCSEGVLWLVLRQPAEISETQLAAFKKLYPMNARPVQPLNRRRILESL